MFPWILQIAFRTLQTLRSTRAAIDLASIMVGVLVIGIISGIASVVIFAVIPWAQDEAAKGNASAAITAERVAQVSYERFLPGADLDAEGLLPASDSMAIATDADGSCFIAVAKSDAGALFYGTERSPNVKTLTPATSPTCLDAAAIDTLVGSIGGWNDADSTEPPTDEPSTPAVDAPVFTTTSLTPGTAGVAYSVTIEAPGATTITGSGLPAGLTLSNSGVISGTPTRRETASVTVTAENATAAVSRTFTLTVRGLTDTDLLANGSFDSDVSGWTITYGDAPVFNPTSPYAGNGSMLLPSDAYVTQSVPVIAGETVNVSAALSSAPSGFVGVSVIFQNAAGAEISNNSAMYVGGTPSWGFKAVSYVVPAGATKAEVALWAAEGPGAFDSVSLTAQRIG